MNDCVFCARIESGEFHWFNELAVAFDDAFPVGPGHTLVVPRLHEPDLFALQSDTREAVWALIDAVHADLAIALNPDAFNIGANIGAAAGQTVDHAHLHIIPRFAGDVADPRGGVRWVLPDRAPYWASDSRIDD